MEKASHSLVQHGGFGTNIKIAEGQILFAVCYYLGDCTSVELTITGVVVCQKGTVKTVGRSSETLKNLTLITAVSFAERA